MSPRLNVARSTGSRPWKLMRTWVSLLALVAARTYLGVLLGFLLWTLLPLAASPGRRDSGDRPDRPDDSRGTGSQSTDDAPTGRPPRRRRRRSAAVAMSVPGLLIGPLGGGVALAAYSTVSVNPSSTFAAAA